MKKISIFILFIFSFSFSHFAIAATWTQTSQADWQTGTLSELNASDDLVLSSDQNEIVHTSKNDFLTGYSENFEHDVIVNSDGTVSLSKYFSYNATSSPRIAENYLVTINKDITSGLLYVGGSNKGLSVIDTKNTVTTSDDELVAVYDTDSTPAIPNNRINYTWLDNTNNLLYVHTNAGVTVINDQGTVTMDDDVLIGTYSTLSTPAIPGNSMDHGWMDQSTNYLYFSDYSTGLTVIDTKGTFNDISDDTFVITYNNVSTPALSAINAVHSWKDDVTGFLYVSVNRSTGGLNVIDTKMTTSTADDVLINVYNTFSAPTIHTNFIKSSYMSTTTSMLYLNGSGVIIIDTNFTTSTVDDVAAGIITTAGTVIAGNYSYSFNVPNNVNLIYDSYLDEDSDYLYVYGWEGIGMVNTDGTATTVDDVLLYNFSTSTVLAMDGSTIADALYDKDNNILYVATDQNGLVAYNFEYNNDGEYLSPLVAIASSSKTISWDVSTSTGTSIDIQTRTGSSTSYWEDEFDDGATSTVEDFSGGGMFSSVEETGGILTMGGNDPYGWGASFFINTGMGDNYFATNSLVKIKIRVNTSDTDYTDSITLDDYETYFSFKGVNRWQIIEIRAEEPFSKIGFEPVWSNWNPSTDSIEIDWIKIYTPNNWSSWSDVCSDNTGSLLVYDDTDTYLQYKATLNGSTNTPVLNSVTLSRGYESSGTYTSAIFDTGFSSDWGVISWSSTEAASTSMAIKVRTGNQANLSDASAFSSLSQTIVSGSTDISTLAGVTDENRYIQFEATFISDNPLITPILSSLSIDYSEHVVQAAPSGGGGGGSFLFFSIPTQTVQTEEVVAEPIEEIIYPEIELYTKDIITEIIDIATAESTVVNLISMQEAEAIVSQDSQIELSGSAEVAMDKIISTEISETIDPLIKKSIANFISAGTQTTLKLGEGERAGVVDSFIFAFGKYPETSDDWSDIIKIANGRWPTQINEDAEARAIENFKDIYLREPDRNNLHDDAAVVIMAYGLRPALRNLDSETAALKIFVDIFDKVPETPEEWDMVRAIAYSGAVR